MPSGLDAAVGTLSTEQCDSVKQMLESLTDEQKAQLKQALDEFKPQADAMDLSAIGESFFDILSSVANSQKSTATADNQVDI